MSSGGAQGVQQGSPPAKPPALPPCFTWRRSEEIQQTPRTPPFMDPFFIFPATSTRKEQLFFGRYRSQINQDGKIQSHPPLPALLSPIKGLRAASARSSRAPRRLGRLTPRWGELRG